MTIKNVIFFHYFTFANIYDELLQNYNKLEPPLNAGKYLTQPELSILRWSWILSAYLIAPEMVDA